MWKEKRNGNVRYKDRIRDPFTGAEKTISVTMKGKYSKLQEREARALLDTRIDELYAPTRERTDSLTLGEIAELYRADQKRTVSEQTQIRNYHAVNSLLRMLGSDVLADKLTAGYVRQKFNASDKSNGTLNEHMTRLKAFLRWGYRNDYVEDIAWLDKLTPYDDEESKAALAEKYLEPEELERLLEAMEEPHWQQLTQFLALTGMRCGEALGLQVDDVDIFNKTIHIRGSLSSVTGKLGSTKTRKQRDIYMQGELVDLCRRIDLARKETLLRVGARSSFYFCQPDGKPLEYYAYNKYLRNLASRVLDRDHETTTHIMRHTHVALMAAQGVSLEAISRRLGHSDSKITKQVYFHVTEQMRERDNAEFEKVKLLS